MPVAPRLVAELNASLPGAVRRGDVPLVHGSREALADRLPTGFAALDAALDGGLPRGRLSELVAAGSTGATSLALAILGRMTAQTHVAAWVDAPDAFDPASAVAAGIDLERLLWIRPPDLSTAFTATEAVLAMGGFPLVVLDAAPRQHAEGGRMAAALGTWLRLARTAARSQSTLVVLQRTQRRGTRRDGPHAAPTAGSAAAVRLELEPRRVVWDRRGGAPSLLDGLVAQVLVVRNRGARGGRRVLLEFA